MDRVLKFWPIIALTISVGSMGVTGWFQIKANAQGILVASESWEAEAARIWLQLKEIIMNDRDKGKAINELTRGDDRLQAKIELEATKLRGEIKDASREQSAKLDEILRAIQAQ